MGASTNFLDESVDLVFADRKVKRFLKELRKHAESGDLDEVIRRHMADYDKLNKKYVIDITQGDFITGMTGYAMANLFISGDFDWRLEVSTNCSRCEEDADPAVSSKSRRKYSRKIPGYIPTFEFYSNIEKIISKWKIDPYCMYCDHPIDITGFKHYIVPQNQNYGQIVKFIVMRQKNITRFNQKFVSVAYKKSNQDIGDNNGVTVVLNYQGHNAARKFRNYFGNRSMPIDLDELANGTGDFPLLWEHDVIPAGFRTRDPKCKKKKTPMKDAAIYAAMLTYLNAVETGIGFWKPFRVRKYIDDNLVHPKIRPTGDGAEEFRMLKSYLQVDRAGVLTIQDLDNIHYRIAKAKGWDIEDMRDISTNKGSVTIEVRFEDVDNWERGHDPNSPLSHQTYEYKAEQLYAGLLARKPEAAAMHNALLRIFGM